jgi:hypothetical protein
VTTILWQLPQNKATSACNDALRRWRKIRPLESVRVTYRVDAGYDFTGQLVRPRPLHWLVRLTFNNKSDAMLFKLAYMDTD